MKKKIIIVIIALLVIIIGVLTYFIVKDNKVSADEKKFKKEYESFNGKKNVTSDKYYRILDIPEKNGIVYSSSDEVIELLSEGTGIIYFGFPECPWCRSMIVPFLETIVEEDETVYYYNALSIRDIKELDDDGNVKTLQEGTDKYYKILELLGDKASIYDGLNDQSIKRLYFPTVVFVKNGEIVDIHVSTIDSQKDPYKKLSSKQIKELKQIFKSAINKLHNSDSSTVCSGKDSC